MFGRDEARVGLVPFKVSEPKWSCPTQQDDRWEVPIPIHPSNSFALRTEFING